MTSNVFASTVNCKKSSFFLYVSTSIFYIRFHTISHNCSSGNNEGEMTPVNAAPTFDDFYRQSNPNVPSWQDDNSKTPTPGMQEVSGIMFSKHLLILSKHTVKKRKHF